jgi:hypothetical protein
MDLISWAVGQEIPYCETPKLRHVIILGFSPLDPKSM